MDALEVSKPIEDFLNFLRDCEQQYHIAEAEEQEANNQTQDILHSLELEPHNYHEYARLGKELVTVRQNRRTAKDTMDMIAPVLRWKSDNRTCINSMEQLLGIVRKAEKRIENRIYMPRSKKRRENDDM